MVQKGVSLYAMGIRAYLPSVSSSWYATAMLYALASPMIYFKRL